jgi:hypothetical protein
MKAIVFYASLFPAFADISALTLPDIALILLATVVTVEGIKLAYAFAATKVMTMSKKQGLGNKIWLASGVPGHLPDRQSLIVASLRLFPVQISASGIRIKSVTP